MSEITNPHDSFASEMFSRKEVAVGFFKEYLPEQLRRRIDLNTLEISKDSFVDKELHHHFSDLLYTVKYHQTDLYLYLLFEHKSSPDHWVGLQLLRYMVRIWELFRKQQPKAKQLPVVIPLVLYHGRNKWQIPKSFSSLLAQEDEYLRQYSPDFQYLLYDFSLHSDEQIKGEALGRIALEILRHIFDPHLADKLPAIINLLEEVNSKETTLEILEILLRYVVKGTKRFVEKDIVEILGHTVIEDNIMKTFIDEYIDQGLKKGRQEGRQEVLSTQLVHRFGVLPKWASSKIDAADMETLDRWFLKILSAEKLDDVFH